MEESKPNAPSGRTIVSLSAQSPCSAIATSLSPGSAYLDTVRGHGLASGLVYGGDVGSVETPAGSVALHPVYGDIYWSHYWRFSTQDFIDDLRRSDADPSVIAHLIWVDSPGGVCFGCHEAFEAVKGLEKPCVAMVDTLCASAAYWISCAAGKVYTSSPLSMVGSIGAMGVFTSYEEFLRREGIIYREYYSSHSDLKNKMGRDALDGRPDEYIERILDPIAELFISDVRSARDVDGDSEALRGKDYLSLGTTCDGLTDGQRSLEDVLSELHALSEASVIDINGITL